MFVSMEMSDFLPQQSKMTEKGYFTQEQWNPKWSDGLGAYMTMTESEIDMLLLLGKGITFGFWHLIVFNMPIAQWLG